LIMASHQHVTRQVPAILQIRMAPTTAAPLCKYDAQSTDRYLS
jgi:hypothetical protein